MDKHIEFHRQLQEVEDEIAEKVFDKVTVNNMQFQNNVTNSNAVLQTQLTNKVECLLSKMETIERNVYRNSIFIFVMFGVMFVLSVLFFNVNRKENEHIKHDLMIEQTLDSVFNMMKQEKSKDE